MYFRRCPGLSNKSVFVHWQKSWLLQRQSQAFGSQHNSSSNKIRERGWYFCFFEIHLRVVVCSVSSFSCSFIIEKSPAPFSHFQDIVHAENIVIATGMRPIYPDVSRRLMRPMLCSFRWTGLSCLQFRFRYQVPDSMPYPVTIFFGWTRLRRKRESKVELQLFPELNCTLQKFGFWKHFVSPNNFSQKAQKWSLLLFWASSFFCQNVRWKHKGDQLFQTN